MQESGLTEIIPLICISAIGACPVLSHPEYPQGSPLGVAVLLLLKVLFAQLRPTLCNNMDSSLPGSSVYGILQARMLACVAVPFSRDLPKPRIKPKSPVSQADCLHLGHQGSPVVASRMQVFFVPFLIPSGLTSTL